MSHRRAPGVPDVPPFRGGGGPLQARGVPNQSAAQTGAYPLDAKLVPMKGPPAPPSKAMMPPPPSSTKTSQQQQRSRTAASPSTRDSKSSAASSSHRQRVPDSSRTDAEPRPSSRLANEKKRDYKDPPVIGPWKLGKLIGQGASGRVRHAVHTVTGMQAAIKIVPKQILASSRMSIRDVSAKQDKMTLGIEREIVIMKLIEHPNVLGLMDVYETSKELYLVLEYVAGGELFDYLVSKGRLRPSEARAYFRQIIFGLHYCHSFNICHRDLKPENLLLDGTKRIVKVADFGMAALQPSEKMLETSCGSPHYASPEIVSGKSYKGTASDIWSCGIILFALLCGRLPFDDPNIQTLLGKVRLGKFDMPDYLEGQAKDLIGRMLTVDPEKRLNMKDIMRHPWFTDNGKLSDSNPVSTDLDKIAEEEMDRDNLDMDILSNLKTLWPEYSQQDIVHQLTTKNGPNWQKTFYSLLVQHRENYSGDDDSDDDVEAAGEVMGARTSPAKGNSLGLSLGIPAPAVSASAASSAKTANVQPVAMVNAGASSSQPRSAAASPRPISVTQTNAASPVRPLSPTRPQSGGPRSPPFARPANGVLQPPVQVTDENRRPVSMVASPPGSPSVRRPLPSPSQSPQPSPAKSMHSPAKGFGSATHAQQTLQPRPQASVLQKQDAAPAFISPVRPVHDRARSDFVTAGSARSASPTTPNRTRLRSSSVAADDATPKQAVSTAPPPRPSSRNSVARPSSAQGHRGVEDRSPTVQLSGQMGNASMQQFFREIADELAAIRVNGERPVSLQRKLEQLERMAADVRSDARSQSPRRSPRRDDDPMAQFDDAEDDVDDGYSVRSGGTASDASGQPYTPGPLSPPMLVENGFGVKTKPLAVVDKDGFARMPGAVIQTARTTSVQSTASASTSSSSNGGSTLGRRRSLLLGRMKSQKKQQSAAAPPTPSESQSPSSLAYERLQEAGQKTGGQSTRLQSRNPGLGLDIGSPALGGASLKSPTLSAYSAQSSAPPTPSTPGSVLMTPGSRSSSSSQHHSSPKQSWFAGLFNWKPATCTLMSVDNFSITHAETKRLLLGCGARVFVEDSENAGVLKCSLAEVRGAQHGGGEVVPLPGAKPLRFRVEFQILPMSSVGSPAMGTPRSMGPVSPALSAHGGVTYATSVTLVQEKGSLSTFKHIYHALGEVWTLDAPTVNSPAFPSIGSPAAAQVGLGVSVMRNASSTTSGSERGSGMMSPRFR